MEDLDTDDVLKIFKLYIGLKLHFSSNTFVYHDNFRNKSLDEHSMNKRRDIDIFIEVTAQYFHKQDELKQYLISLFKTNPDTWIGDVLDRSKTAVHTKRMNAIMNLSRHIEKDMTKVKDFMATNNVDIDTMLAFENDRPLIVKKLRVSDEFLAILDMCRPYLQQETDNPLWKKRSKILCKYKYLLDTSDDILNMFDALLLK